MSQINKLKILNDPIYGFITLPENLIFDLIQHPYFQRLRRISQMGLSYLVYPGAHHTRFQHAIGCLHLMQKAIEVIRFKGTEISKEEERALYIAILLHDIGHGPFSHAMEHSIVENVNHENISLLLMNQLNMEFEGQLDLAITIFKEEYHRKFMLQLVSSQLDIDRLDYLKRDSFFSGVAEGNINSDRLIQMMNVVNDVLVIEEKGIYSVEKFIMTRRLMYWQVYFHKTSLVAELILTKILKRARYLVKKQVEINCSSGLLFFIKNTINIDNFDIQTLDKFSQLDDFDIMSAIKEWQFHNDFVLQNLSKMILNRDLLKIKMSSKNEFKPFVKNQIIIFAKQQNITIAEAKNFVFEGKITNQAYNLKAEPIRILNKDKSIHDVVLASDQLHAATLTKKVVKYYCCFPKVVVKN